MITISEREEAKAKFKKMFRKDGGSFIEKILRGYENLREQGRGEEKSIAMMREMFWAYLPNDVAFNRTLGTPRIFAR